MKYRLFSGMLIAGLLTGCKSPDLPAGPPLDRVTAWDSNPTYTYAREEKLMEWIEEDTPSSVIHTPENRWLNSFAACMEPFMVDWQQSDVSGSDEEYVIVHNVQVQGNPILGTSRLSTIRIPEHGIERIEYVIVRYGLKGPAKTSGHVQLRFIFKTDHRPLLYDRQGNPDLEQPYLDDLIVSWEAWRPTNTSWKFLAGLDPEQYGLTARMFSGNQRFLNDSLRGAVWDCYPLQLPEDEDAADMILWSCLIMGDSMARTTLSNMLREQLHLNDQEQIETKWTQEQKDQARQKLSWSEIPDDVFKDLLEGADYSYHAIERSCINLALLQIELAMERLYKEKDLGERDQQINWRPEGEIPDWFHEIVERDGEKVYLHALHAFFWALSHKEILPYKAYIPLKEAGMLQTDSKGHIIRYRYNHKTQSPYGNLRRNLM